MIVDLLRSAYYRMPESIQRAILVKRREPIWTDVGIVFIHVPKAAGTSINAALYGRFMGHVYASEIERWGSARLKALPSFAVTRNPWDRLVSAYRFARRLIEHDWKGRAFVPRPVRSQIPDLVSFESFVTRWLKHQDLRKANQIFQPQSLYICDRKGSILVDHVGPLENLAGTTDFLRAHLGEAPLLQRSNLSGQPVDYRTYYNSELAKLVGELYAEDVQNFGYKFEGTTL